MDVLPAIPAVCLFGNGLSNEYSDSFKTSTLTADVRAAVDAMGASPGAAQDLAAFAAQLSAGVTGVDPEQDFERLVGPLDQLADALIPLERVANALQQLPAGLAFSKARDVTRALYLRMVGVILNLIASRIGLGAEAIRPISEISAWALQSFRCHSVLKIFTLNYDGLLASRLLESEQNRFPLPFHLSDMFYGWHGALDVQQAPAHIEIIAHPYRKNEREYLLGGNNCVLYHLHGSLSWLQDQTTGEIYKAHQLEEVRANDLFGKWSVGEDLLVRPLVVLGNNKQKTVLKAPFSWAYRSLLNSASEARRVLIGGYSFRDAPVNDSLNRALRTAVRSGLQPRWLVITKAEDQAARDNFRARVESAFNHSWLGANFDDFVTIRFNGLSTALDQLHASWWCPDQPEQP